VSSDLQEPKVLGIFSLIAWILNNQFGICRSVSNWYPVQRISGVLSVLPYLV